MVYFCQYLGWDMRDYQLHYFGPFSMGLAGIISTAEDMKLIRNNEEDAVAAAAPHMWNMTADGIKFLGGFTADLCNNIKVKNIRDLVEYFSSWSTQQLELAATIDIISKNNPGIPKVKLLDKVADTKRGNYSQQQIRDAHGKWLHLKKNMRAMCKPVIKV